MRSRRRPLGASIVNKPFPKYHGSRWLFGASHDIFEERSFAMLPYDGSPGGNALGMQFDEERRRFHDETIGSLSEPFERPRSGLQWAAYLLALAVFLFVMFYGTVG
jgi:hypothetical protein